MAISISRLILFIRYLSAASPPPPPPPPPPSSSSSSPHSTPPFVPLAISFIPRVMNKQPGQRRQHQQSLEEEGKIETGHEGKSTLFHCTDRGYLFQTLSFTGNVSGEILAAFSELLAELVLKLFLIEHKSYKKYKLKTELLLIGKIR